MLIEWTLPVIADQSKHWRDKPYAQRMSIIAAFTKVLAC